MNELTHIDSSGKAQMADVGAKAISARRAVARCMVELPEKVLELLEAGDIRTKKGAVFQTAIIAGIMAAKKTGELIPLCHPLGLDHCHIDIYVNAERMVVVECIATITGKTGVEMEALIGANIAALTIYDMCKAVSHDIVIRETMLIEKSGGKSDFKRK